MIGRPFKKTRIAGETHVRDNDRRQLAETRLARRAGKLWAGWRQSGRELEAAKRDATILALKLQEDAGIDIVSDGEQARQHFVHGFLENIEGINFGRKVEMGIRNNRYKAMVPTVDAQLRLKGRVHASRPRPRGSIPSAS